MFGFIRRQFVPPCRIMIIGGGKSGTTGLFFRVMRNVEKHYGFEFDRLFEPKERAALERLKRHAITKILGERMPELKISQELIESFDKRLLIVRDPRDVLISRLMWIVATRLAQTPQADVGPVLEALQEKERNPSSLSTRQLVEIAMPVFRRGSIPKERSDEYRARQLSRFLENMQRHVFLGARLFKEHSDFELVRYEDFVDERLERLETYLGFPLDVPPDLPLLKQKVLRTGQHGSWRNWFLDEDYECFVKPNAELFERLGYAPEPVPAGTPRFIPRAEITGYIERVRDLQEAVGQNAAAGWWRNLLVRLGTTGQDWN
jgi:hypothetical protein